MENRAFDVAVVGGAFSGSATALLLKRDNPDLRIVLIDKKAAFDRKVGESSIELAAWFLTRKLGLDRHLATKHLPKYGQRYWFHNDKVKTLADASELGNFYQSLLPSYHVDRAVLDEHVHALAAAAGVEVLRPARVTDVELKDGGSSSLPVESAAGKETIDGALDRRCDRTRGDARAAARPLQADARASDPVHLGALSEPARLRRRLARAPQGARDRGVRPRALHQPPHRSGLLGLGDPASRRRRQRRRRLGRAAADDSAGGKPGLPIRKVHEQLPGWARAARGRDARRRRHSRAEGAPLPRDESRRRRVGGGRRCRRLHRSVLQPRARLGRAHRHEERESHRPVSARRARRRRVGHGPRHGTTASSRWASRAGSTPSTATSTT